MSQNALATQAMAMLAQQRPRFEVEELSGTRKHTIREMVIKEAAIPGRAPKISWEAKEVEEPAGFMVYFPNGHSFRVRTKEELERLKLDGNPYLDPNEVEQQDTGDDDDEGSKALS